MKCIFCDDAFDKDSPSKVCGVCGVVQQKFKDTADHPVALNSFESILHDLFFHAGPLKYDSEDINKTREDNAISYGAGVQIFQQIEKLYQHLSKYLSCKFEFDENLLEAYAGGDTLLRFQFTNNSGEILKSIELTWDDKLTNDEDDYKVRTTSPVMRNSQIILEGTHVFERPGSKTIGGVSNDLIITIETLGKGTIKFKSNPFSFTINNPNKNVYNSISNNTSINVEAERVVGTFDASKTDASQTIAHETSKYKWKELKLVPLTNQQGNTSSEINKLSATISPIEKNDSEVKISDKIEKDIDKTKTTNNIPNEALLDEYLNKPKPSTSLEAVETFISGLKFLSQISPLHQEKSVITSVDLSIEIVQKVTENLNELNHADIFGLMIREPESAYIDSLGYICGFEGHGYVFTTYGLMITTNGSNSNNYSLTRWQDWIAKGISPQIRRYSSTQFLIFLGEKSGQSVSGFSFDLRRYNGDVPIERIFNKINEAYLWIVKNPINLLDQEEANTNNELVEDDSEETDDEEFPDGWISPYNTTSVPVAVNDLFYILEKMCLQGGIHAYKTCTRTYFTMYLFQNLYNLLEAEDENEILGAIFEEPDQISFKENLVNNFSGRAVIFGELGISIVHSNGDIFKIEEELMWYEFTQKDIQLFRYGDKNTYSYVFATRNSTQVEATTIDLTDVDCDEIDDDSKLSINEYWARCSEIINFIKTVTALNNTEDENENENDEEEEEEEREEQTIENNELEALNRKQLEDQNHAIQAGEKFISLLSFTLQQCSESVEKRLFSKGDVSSLFFDELYISTGQSGSGPYAIAIENYHLAEFTSEGKLSSWSGNASLISPEGIFHMTKANNSIYCLDGKNSFLSWKKIFNNFSAGLQIREDGPDLWFGNKEKILITGLYCDYSDNIAQWEYFEDFVQSDLIDAFNNMRDCYITK